VKIGPKISISTTAGSTTVNRLRPNSGKSACVSCSMTTAKPDIGARLAARHSPWRGFRPLPGMKAMTPATLPTKRASANEAPSAIPVQAAPRSRFAPLSTNRITKNIWPVRPKSAAETMRLRSRLRSSAP